ncbi:hypothetical protein PUNSTDRAFT_123873 [Punctularia strigosozonata HHB-11173 SS5]|uniref:uncharacterized protein n=1 Tax=Punctularia strigosozonata (strain HHB-11173) TaxID=741275 RepID=UPI0004417EA3|nr:uncharacterized protein PUNSTDRAFT_123873 [Punctularia strigosozonata HHB-11173 SS5]EIN14254.1 hypothetical protein PUNSTDRAFT_123873 [Punctularia strigosozonata HHB-11173 SS5]
MSSSLSSVVSDLVRAQMGSSVPSTVSDEDLDRHVAELILKEARQKADRYATSGIAAYLPQKDSNAPKTNKRFLSSIIRSTDDHNRTILRAQAEAAEELRLQREEEERHERRKRAEEAVEAERMRLRRLMGRSRRREHDHDRNGKGKRRERSWERRNDREREETDEDYDREHRKRRARDDGDHGRRREKEPESKKGYSRSGEKGSRRESQRERGYHHEDDRLRRGSRTHSQDERPRASRSRSRDRDSPSKYSRKRRNHDEESHSRRHRSRSLSSQYQHDEPSSRSSPPAPSKHSPSPERLPSPAEVQPVQYQRAIRGRLKHSKTEAMSSSAAPRLESPPDAVCTPPSKARSPSSHTLLSQSRSPSRSLSPGPSLPTKSKLAKSGASPRPPSSPPPVPPPLPSKMDRYFEAGYDPRLDTAPLLSSTSKDGSLDIPKTGIIPDESFAGWDAMLELLKQRRQDKDEKKRMERLGGTKERGKDKKGKKKIGAEWGKAGLLADESEPNVMNMVYKKKGAVREWDLGKEGL